MYLQGYMYARLGTSVLKQVQIIIFLEIYLISGLNRLSPKSFTLMKMQSTLVNN